MEKILQLKRGHNLPAIHPFSIHVTIPANKARTASLARSPRRAGQMALMPPIWIPIEAIFEKPHKA